MLRSRLTFLALMLAPALAGHLAFDAVDGGPWTVLARPIHAVYLIVVFGAFVAAVLQLYAHRPAERYRRIALMQAPLRGRGQPVVLSLMAQIVLATVTVQLEGVVTDTPHLVLGVLCGLIALVCGGLALRRVHFGVLRLVRAVFAPRRPVVRFVFSREAVRLCAALARPNPYARFRPNRPPPAFA
jgi:hypothetical protein